MIVLGLIILGVLAVGLIAVTILEHRSHKKHRAAPTSKAAPKNAGQAVDAQVAEVFNKEFREELRNRGRLHFEKIIGENAMFLQQDLRLTTSQLNEYMKTEITTKLKEEFAKYEESIMDAKQLAVESIEKTNIAIDEQRLALSQQLQEQVAAEKAQLIKHFEEDMARIINHYVLAAIGDQIDLNDQLEYILAELEANKQNILKDISNG